jgi:hypothetical protein
VSNRHPFDLHFFGANWPPRENALFDEGVASMSADEFWQNFYLQRSTAIALVFGRLDARLHITT